MIKTVFSRWATTALHSLNGGVGMEYVVTVVNGGCESCWASANQSDPQVSSEHIIAYEEAEALFSAMITQTLEGPVRPPRGLVSDALEMNLHVYTAHFKKLDGWGWSCEILFFPLKTAGQTLSHLPSSGSPSITSCSVPLVSDTTHTDSSSGSKLLNVKERMSQDPTGRCSSTSHDITWDEKLKWE